MLCIIVGFALNLRGRFFSHRIAQAMLSANKSHDTAAAHGRWAEALTPLLLLLSFPDKNINQNLHLVGVFAVGINLIYDCPTIIINAISGMQ